MNSENDNYRFLEILRTFSQVDIAMLKSLLDGNVEYYFKDENFVRRHAHAGLLSMANCGANTNASQFFVTLKECPHLDGKHVVFGQVVEGMQTIRDIAKVPTDMYEKPKIPVHIVDCG